MAEGKRLPGVGFLIVLLFIAAPIAATAWWLYRPTPDVAPGPDLAHLDVVCSGRVDGLHPTASLEPSVPGRVLSVEVTEGDEVKAGQPLIKLDDSSAQLRVEEADAAVSASTAELDAARTEAKFQPGRIEAAKAVVAAAVARVQAARQLQDQRKAQQSITKVTAAELAAGEAEVRQYEQLEAGEKERLKELQGFDPNLKVRVAEARLATAAVAVKVARKTVEDCVMTSPSAGTILRVQTGKGEAVTPGGVQAPVIFRPAGPLVVRAELEQEFLGRVALGMKATVRDETRPDSPTWTGKLTRISGWIARRRSVVMEPGELNDVRTAECLVTLDPSPDPLLVGQRVRVRFSRTDAK